MMLWLLVGAVAYVALLVLVLRVVGRGARRRRGLDREAYLRQVDWVEWEAEVRR